MYGMVSYGIVDKVWVCPYWVVCLGVYVCHEEARYTGPYNARTIWYVVSIFLGVREKVWSYFASNLFTDLYIFF